MQRTLITLLLATLAMPAYAVSEQDYKIIAYQYGQALAINMPEEIQGKKYLADVMQGFHDAQNKQKSRYSDEEILLANANIQQEQELKYAEQAKQNKIKSEQFLRENAKKAGVITTKSGLQYKIIKQGTTKKPKTGSNVLVHYEGRSMTGEVFDSSYERFKPAQFQLGVDVIEGFSEGLQHIGAGGEIELYIPPHLAYGEVGMPQVGANSVLIFKVKLLEVD